MLRIIVYDICNPRRLRRVAKLCERYAARVEESVFECNLPEDEFNRFCRDLSCAMNPEEDFLIVYPICAACEAKIAVEGRAVRPLKQDVFVF